MPATPMTTTMTTTRGMHEIRHKLTNEILFVSGTRLLQHALALAVRKRVDLAGANLRGMNLRGAWLGGGRLVAADLRDADLTNADLRFADLRNADLRGAILTGARLDGAIWMGALGAPDVLSGAIFSEPAPARPA